MKLPLPFILIVLLSFFNPVSAQDANEGKFDIFFLSGTISPNEDIKRQTSLDIDESEIVYGRVYRIIQFNEIPNDETRALMELNGIKLLDYIPNYAYFASIAQEVSINTLQTDKFKARAVLKIEPVFKTHPLLTGGSVPDWAELSPGMADLIIHVFNDVAINRIEQVLPATGFEIQVLEKDVQARTLTIRVPFKHINSIALLPYISYVEPIEPPATLENITGTSLHRSNTINNQIPGGLRYDGSGVVVSVGDGGLIFPHQDLKGRLTYGSTNSSSHATHVAGIIGGAGNIEPISKGQAPGVDILSYNSHNDISNSSTITNLYNNSNVRVTNHSLGQGCNDGYNANARLADLHVASMPGLFNVFSAGNSGTSDCGYGAGSGWGNITGGYKAAKNSIAVGNLSRLDAISSSSSRGPSADGRIKPDICAKGSSVYSTYPNDEYSSISGTSMAAPGVAGCISQLIHAYRDMNNGADPKLAFLKAVVLNTAEDLGNPGPDYIYGWGRINVWRAFNLMQKNNYTSGTVSNGMTNTHSITVPAGVKQLKVMVYWADPAAVSGVSKALINDLDIRLNTPTNQVFDPWTLSILPNATELNKAAVRGKDRRNNMEQVTLANPDAGVYTLHVEGFLVPSGPQEYFVVYEFIEDEITVISPMGGESLVPGEVEYIRWDATGTVGNFKIEYSTNNGSSWTTLSSSVQGNRLYYAWTVPNLLTGNALVRVSRNGIIGTSNSVFSIINVPQDLKVDYRCPGDFGISWSAVPGASEYEVFLLGAKYMEPVGITSNTNYIVNASNNIVRWASVNALAQNGQVIGRRAIAIKIPTSTSGCSLAPPTANFNSPNTSPCNGLVKFNDVSTNNPSNWLWDFGDGNTSTVQNPVHIYTGTGNYTVSLSISNSAGTDATTKVSYISVVPQPEPVTSDGSRCGEGIVNLFATGLNKLNWYSNPVGGTVVNTGSGYSPSLAQTTNFYVESSTYATVPTVQKVGPASNNIGAGGYFSTNDQRGLVFDVLEPMKLKSVYVYSDLAANRTIEVYDAVMGNLLDSKTVYVPTGGSRVILDFILLPGSNYHIKCTGTVNLYRNNSGTNFPYAIQGLVSIKGTDASDPTGYYYFFYDWEVQELGCRSGLATVTGTIEDCTGLEDALVLDKQITVFPNPTPGIFEAKFNIRENELLNIEVFNLVGQLIYSRKANTTGTFTETIDISSSAPGLYTLKVTAGEKEDFYKIVKQ